MYFKRNFKSLKIIQPRFPFHEHFRTKMCLTKQSLELKVFSRCQSGPKNFDEFEIFELYSEHSEREQSF